MEAEAEVMHDCGHAVFAWSPPAHLHYCTIQITPNTKHTDLHRCSCGHRFGGAVSILDIMAEKPSPLKRKPYVRVYWKDGTDRTFPLPQTAHGPYWRIDENRNELVITIGQLSYIRIPLVDVRFYEIRPAENDTKEAS